MTSSTPPRVAAGWVGVEVACPVCGVLEHIAVRLTGVLTTPDDETPTLRVRARSKPLDHDCGRIDVTLFDQSEAKSDRST